VRTTGHVLIDGTSFPMQRHFILAITAVPHRVAESH
jgi:hypothetical protein